MGASLLLVGLAVAWLSVLLEQPAAPRTVATRRPTAAAPARPAVAVQPVAEVLDEGDLEAPLAA